MENRKYTLTTKEHYNKYKNLINGIDKEVLINFVKDLYKNKEELQNKFNEDIVLNNIKMRNIDNKFNLTRNLVKDKIKYIEENKTYTSLSLAESCCIIKHILIYIVLDIKPFFEEDILNYNELFNEWKTLPHNKQYPKTKPSYSRNMWFLDNKHKWIFKTE